MLRVSGQHQAAAGIEYRGGQELLSQRGAAAAVRLSWPFLLIPVLRNKILAQSSRAKVNLPFDTWIVPTAHPSLPLQQFKHLD